MPQNIISLFTGKEQERDFVKLIACRMSHINSWKLNSADLVVLLGSFYSSSGCCQFFGEDVSAQPSFGPTGCWNIAGAFLEILLNWNRVVDLPSYVYCVVSITDSKMVWSGCFHAWLSAEFSDGAFHLASGERFATDTSLSNRRRSHVQHLSKACAVFLWEHVWGEGEFNFLSLTYNKAY